MSTVIVLNKNYQFWTEASIPKVLKWYSLNKIEIVLADESEEIGSMEVRIKMPLVVRLLEFIGYKPKKEAIPYSADAVYKRDDNICQFWHKDQNGRKFKYRCTSDDRSIDHVLPISRGGSRNSFTNSVCACKDCNINVKKNRLPEEVGLELIRKPFVPKRNKDEFVIMKFAYNKSKKSHMEYLHRFLGEA
jgi:HNH endonuclease